MQPNRVDGRDRYLLRLFNTYLFMLFDSLTVCMDYLLKMLNLEKTHNFKKCKKIEGEILIYSFILLILFLDFPLHTVA